MADAADGTWLSPTEHQWPDPDRGPWRLLLLWQVVDGRPECVGATVLSAQPPTQDPGQPLTGNVLRGLRLPERIAADRAQMIAGKEATHAPGIRRSAAARFEEVARVYREALADGQRPVKAVAAQFRISEPSASNLVHKVRAAGFLPPTSPGVPQG